jgi:hypothetical protein
MFPSAHIASGVILFTLSQLLGINPLLSLPLVIGAVLPDFDCIFNRMHRTQITHAPLFWFLSLTPLALIWQQFLFLEIGVFVHLILDTLDWGVMWLHPFNNNLYGGVLKKYRSNFSHHYLLHNGLFALEIVFAVIAIYSSYFVLL